MSVRSRTPTFLWNKLIICSVVFPKNLTFMEISSVMQYIIIIVAVVIFLLGFIFFVWFFCNLFEFFDMEFVDVAFEFFSDDAADILFVNSIDFLVSHFFFGSLFFLAKHFHEWIAKSKDA